jgi:hypothetical protein
MYISELEPAPQAGKRSVKPVNGLGLEGYAYVGRVNVASCSGQGGEGRRVGVLVGGY